jgi:hypothetical protein
VMLCTSTWWCTLLRVLGWQTCALGSRVARPLLGAALRSEPTQRPVTEPAGPAARSSLPQLLAHALLARCAEARCCYVASRNQNVIEDHHGKRSRAILPLPDWFGFGARAESRSSARDARARPRPDEPELQFAKAVAGQGPRAHGPGPRELAVPIDREIFGLP